LEHCIADRHTADMTESITMPYSRVVTHFKKYWRQSMCVCVCSCVPCQLPLSTRKHTCQMPISCQLPTSAV